MDHFLFTDSSCARQLSMRQGTDKNKHLSDKILWIQQWVMEGKIVLVQVPTLWNLADIGTKPFPGQRMKLLMHDLNMAHGDCSGLVGQDEFEEQCQRHGYGKQVAKLAKAVARMMSGLGSSTPIGGVGAVILDDDSIQCPAHPNSNDAGTGGAFAVHCEFL